MVGREWGSNDGREGMGEEGGRKGCRGEGRLN